jgi:hypothetical protein
MTNHKEPYTPTEQEVDVVEHAALAAAWQELQLLKDEDLPVKKHVLACLRAFVAVNAVAKDFTNRLEAAHPEASYISFHLPATSIVCSAMMFLDLDGPENIAPVSVFGNRLLPLIQAAKAMESMNSFASAIDDGDEILGTYCADEAITFAEALV